jgi:hypothetical protein
MRLIVIGGQAAGMSATARAHRQVTLAGRERIHYDHLVVAAALTRQRRLEEFEQLDLAYAPPFAPRWDPRLIAAQQLVKLLH